jgi:transcriptional regulator with XRE-family HTH domain
VGSKVLDNKNPSLVDQHVGRRLRWRRRELSMSQEALAERLGVTFQQVQKYERGANRISAGRLYELAKELETTIPYFFQGFEEVGRAVRRGMAEESADFTGLIDADAVDLVIAYQSIRDPELRKSILSMVKKQAKVFAEPPKKGR